MTHQPETLALLRDTEHYLSALHGSVARHDNLAANYGCAGCELRDRIAAAVSAAVAPPTDDTETAEPREPDNPAAWALAQHIADHPVSTVQAAFRYLNAPLTLELREEPAAVTEPTDRAAVSREAEAELYVLLRKAGEPRHEAQALIDRHRDEVLRRAELRRMADETATQTPAADLPTLAAALDGLHTLIATSSRDWQTYRVDAWLWAVLCGWDCEQTEHDETCVHGALEETAAMHGWDEATVAKARRYRAAVRAVTEALHAAGARQDGAEQ